MLPLYLHVNQKSDYDMIYEPLFKVSLKGGSLTQVLLYEYLGRKAWTNDEVDQTLQMWHTLKLHNDCHWPSSVLDTSLGSKMELFKFQEK